MSKFQLTERVLFLRHAYSTVLIWKPEAHAWILRPLLAIEPRMNLSLDSFLGRHMVCCSVLTFFGDVSKTCLGAFISG